MTNDTIRIIAAQIVTQLPTTEIFHCAQNEAAANHILSKYQAGNLMPRLEDAQQLVTEVFEQSRETLVALCAANNWKLEVR